MTGGVIGQAVVAVRAKTSEFIPDLRDGVERPMRQTAANIGSALAGAFAAREILRGGQVLFQAFAEAESASLRLQATFENQRKLAGANVEAFEEYADARMTATRFDDDATKAAIANLAQFKLTEDQLRTLIPLTQDYAARTGSDLVTASSTLGKALLGQGRALKTIGIDFEDAGSRTANFEQLVAGLRAQVGGFAEKEGQTAAGQAAILGNQFGELQEELGAVIADGIGPLIGVTGELIGTFRALPGPIRGVISVATVATGAVVGLGLAAKATTASLQAMGIEIGSGGLLGIVSRFGAGAAQLAAGAYIAAKSLEDQASSASANADAMDLLNERQKALAESSGRTAEYVLDNATAWGEYRRVLAAATELNDPTSVLATNQDELNRYIEIFNRNAGELGSSLRITEDEVRSVADALAQGATPADALAQALGQGTSSSRAFIDSLGGVTEATDTATESSKKHTDALREEYLAELKLAGGFLGVFAAGQQAKEAQRDLTAAEEEVARLADRGKTGSEKYRDALRELHDATAGAIEGQLGLAESVFNYLRERGKVDDGQAVTNSLIREYGERAGLTKSQIGFLRGAVQGLIEDYRNVPSGVHTNVTGTGISDVRRNVQGLISDLRELHVLKNVDIQLKSAYVVTGRRRGG